MSFIIPQELRSEFSINQSGQAFISIRGAMRLLGLKGSGSLTNNLNTARFYDGESNLVKALQEKGFDPLSFSVSGIPDIAFATICEYYAFDAGGRCTKEAKLACRAFLAIGVRTWIQSELDWENNVLDGHPLRFLIDSNLDLLYQYQSLLSMHHQLIDSHDQLVERHYKLTVDRAIAFDKLTRR